MRKKRKIKNEASLQGIIFAIITTFLAKFLGFFRELLVADIFGTSSLGDAFIVSMLIPDILVSGFTAGIATLYIPTYYKLRNGKDYDFLEIKKYNSSVLSFIFIVCVVIVLLTEIFADFIVNIFAPGFGAETASITVLLLRIVIISVIPIGIAGLFKAYGQIVSAFSLLTLAGAVINLSTIIALFFWGNTNLPALAVSTVVGNIIYLFICFRVIRNRGFTCSGGFYLKNKNLSDMLVGIIPVFLSNVVAELNQVIDKNFASRLSEGSISALNYSSKIVNLITAVIGTSISSVLFANLSEIATAGDEKKMAKEIEKINSIVITLIIPIFLFVIFYSKEIVQVLFGRGEFGEKSVLITSESLAFYAIGIIGFNLKAVWVRIYNASLDTKTPALNSGIAVLCNLILNVLLISTMRHKGLALATGVSSVFTDVLLIIFYKKKNQYIRLRKLFKEFIKICISTMGFFAIWMMLKIIPSDSDIINILKSVIWITVGGVIYFIMLINLNSSIGLKLSKIWRKKVKKS